MKHVLHRTAIATALLAAASLAHAQQLPGTIAFTVSMDQPATQTYHVTMRCEGLKNAFAAAGFDFKMPVWTPGYYGLLNAAHNVQNFTATDAAGQALKFEKTADNTWHVESAPIITVTYDLLANRNFVANTFLDEAHAYIMPASLCMNVGGHILHPVTLDIKPNPNWKTIATGLDPVSPDKPYTLAAPDFDILYDSPILIGNIEELPSFDIKGITHRFYAYNLGPFNRELFIKDLKAVVEQGIDVIGDIPYKHYTFIGMGAGQGGIEHLNSTSFGMRGGPTMDTQAGRNSQLRFLAHEYFHHYNVKRIRPIVLGPFDYDHANITNMLWVSEGFTSYYENLMVARAGCMTRDETLDEFTKNLVAYEGKTGRLFQSATQSSHDTWDQGFNGAGRGRGAAPATAAGTRAGAATAAGARAGVPPGRGRGLVGTGIVKTISYYDKGPILGMLLDFKIRHETKNQKSLDTVMQTLYNQYYQEKKRGWTDAEFQAACESVAGVPLTENFEYASTTKEVDYPKYLAYAGLELEPFKELPQPDLRAVVEEKDGKLTITAMESNSAATRAGLKTGDVIKTLDGETLSSNAFADKIAAKKPGDKIKLTINSNNADREVELTLDPKLDKTYRMHAIPNPDPLQAEILIDWLKKK